MNSTQKTASCCSTKKASPCCGNTSEVNDETIEKKQEKQEFLLPQMAPREFFSGWIETPVGKVPQVPAQLSVSDRLGGIRVRLNIGRMDYSVEPGIYAVGNPGADSIVLVTANYKLSFDYLRRELSGIDAWILVLDTKGINVWCAAGKGVFSTKELVNRIEVTHLKEIVNHRKLILPQLGATGVAAHKVRELSGFNVIYGPVHASDLPAFLKDGMKATPQMRRVRYTLHERMKIIPIEVVMGFPKLIIICLVAFLISGISRSGYSIHVSSGLITVLNIFLAFIAGSVVGPLLLPWLPGRAFSVKGMEAGILMFILAYIGHLVSGNILTLLGWFFFIPAFASFITLNFTGSSTYTSLSGVKKEMKLALPVQGVMGALGLLLWISGKFY